MNFCYSGSTAIVLLIREGKMYIANVGDSRAVACWAGRTDPLSFDHKPSNELEAKRIQAAGGWVEFNRVNGNLALSRALGDFVFKRNDDKSVEDQIVTALPDIEVRTISEELEFVVLACDGIWDVMSNTEVVSFIRTRIAAKMEPAIVSTNLFKFYADIIISQFFVLRRREIFQNNCQLSALRNNTNYISITILSEDSFKSLKHYEGKIAALTV